MSKTQITIPTVTEAREIREKNIIAEKMRFAEEKAQRILDEFNDIQTKIATDFIEGNQIRVHVSQLLPIDNMKRIAENFEALGYTSNFGERLDANGRMFQTYIVVSIPS
jgi:hypothetical protein